jgi:hypothetical protein
VQGRAPLRDGDRIQLAIEVIVFRTTTEPISTITTPIGARVPENERPR